MPSNFKSVTFRTEYPAQRVADHEVLMSFNDDADAIAFHEWWNLCGSEDFARWLEQTRRQQRKPQGVM